LNPEKFIAEYSKALGSQNWSKVLPLVAKNAVVTFSDGSTHLGIGQIKLAFEKNFNLIKSEKYAISNVIWIRKQVDIAVYIFEFSWSGMINGVRHSGAGVGTSVIIKENDMWQLLSEHLGKKA